MYARFGVVYIKVYFQWLVRRGDSIANYEITPILQIVERVTQSYAALMLGICK